MARFVTSSGAFEVEATARCWVVFDPNGRPMGRIFPLYLSQSKGRIGFYVGRRAAPAPISRNGLAEAPASPPLRHFEQALDWLATRHQP